MDFLQRKEQMDWRLEEAGKTDTRHSSAERAAGVPDYPPSYRGRVAVTAQIGVVLSDAVRPHPTTPLYLEERRLPGFA
jgi:hypothetical protein